MTVRLIDAIVDRLADTLESATAELEGISEQIFDRDLEDSAPAGETL